MLDWKEQYQHPHWQRKKHAILNRDDYSCRICGETEVQLDVHHLYYEKDGHIWDVDDDGLVTLCKNCHKKIHDGLSKLSGIIAFKILSGELDATDLIDTLPKIK